MQRHRSTVLDCIKDPDLSIRRRALSLAFALVNETNVKSLMKELLVALDAAEPELKTYMTKELLSAAEKFAPSRRWHIDTVLQVFITGGIHISDDAICSTVILIANSPDLYVYTVQRLFTALQANIVSQPLVELGTWCIGEYGHLLVGPLADPEYPCNATSSSVLDLLRSILDSPMSLMITRELALTALMKLSTRLPDQLDRIRTMIGLYNNNVDVELQQRSSEFTSIFNLYNRLRPALLEQMPIAELKLVPANDIARPTTTAAPQAAPAPAPIAPPSEPSLLDLLSDITPPVAVAAVAAPVATAPMGGMLDLLSGLDLGAPAPQPAPSGSSLLDLMGLGGHAATTPGLPLAPPSAPPSSHGAASVGDLDGRRKCCSIK